MNTATIARRIIATLDRDPSTSDGAILARIADMGVEAGTADTVVAMTYADALDLAASVGCTATAEDLDASCRAAAAEMLAAPKATRGALAKAWRIAGGARR